MKKKNRSPLHGARIRDIAALRAVVAANIAWERALGTADQYLHADEPIAALTRLSFATVDQVRARARRRWAQAPHFGTSYKLYLDQHLYRYDRKAWEYRQLSRQVAELRAQVTDLKAPAS